MLDIYISLLFWETYLSVNWCILQAEEAQKLRKRKKAENSRLLNLERRSKERLEEVRETQKKVAIISFNLKVFHMPIILHVFVIIFYFDFFFFL
jgi:hypothetical protein